MTAARRDRTFGTVTGWQAAARALALVLALVVAVPATCLGANLAIHPGDRDRHGTELAVAHDASGTQTTAPGLDGHVHCGCHIAVGLEATGPAPRANRSRLSFAPLAEAVPSVFPDRLPRPPRG